MSGEEASGRFSAKKALVGLVAMLIIVVGLIAVFSDQESDGGEEGEEEGVEKGPLLVSEGGYNINVQDGPWGTNEPSVAVDPNDPMHAIAGANDYNNPKMDAWVGVYATFDGGATWSQGFVPGYLGDPSSISALSGYQGSGDPVAGIGPDGECYMAGIAFQRKHVPATRMSAIFVASSSDGGVTYDNVAIVAQSRTQGVFHDKEWIAVDQNNGNIYCSWTVFYAMGSVGAQILVSTSTDGGRTWSDIPTIVTELRGGEFPQQVQGSYVEVDDEGTVHLTWIDYNFNKVMYTRSYDQGGSFEEPRTIADVTPIPSPLENVVHRTPTMPTMALDVTEGEYDGSVYIAWPDAREGNADIYMIISRDLGDTWDKEFRINDDDGGNDQFFPSICTDDDGHVYAFFYDRRRDDNNTAIDAFWGVSLDGGMNFTHQFNVTTEMFIGDAGGGSFMGQFTSGAFIGDYIQIAVGPKIIPDGGTEEDGYYRMYMFWCDTRNGTPEDQNSDLYAARVDFPV